MIIKYNGKDENVSIPPTIRGEKVTEIGDSSFNAYGISYRIYSITIPDGVTKIGEGAFSGRGWLRTINIPDSVTEISDFAFSSCSGLKTLTIPNSVVSLGEGCFRGCRSLTSITLPNKITAIRLETFSSCENLTSISISANINEIEDDVFKDCAKLTSISVDPNNTVYADVDGVLFNKNKTILMCYPEAKPAASYSIPNSVTEIGKNAFYECKNLTSVTFSDTVTKIGDFAFWYCSNLKNVDISNGVIDVGNNTFTSCTSLASINAGPNNPQFSSVDGILFSKDKTKLVRYPLGRPDKTYTIPSSVVEIGQNSFDDCDNLTSLIIPDSVTSICGWAISFCDNLVDVKIPEEAALTGSGRSFTEPLFGDCKKIQAVYKGQTYDYKHIRDLINAMPRG